MPTQKQPARRQDSELTFVSSFLLTGGTVRCELPFALNRWGRFGFRLDSAQEQTQGCPAKLKNIPPVTGRDVRSYPCIADDMLDKHSGK